MKDESVVVPGNLCVELRGDSDAFGNNYAGPKCSGCEHCKGLESVKAVLRKALPYRACFITNHEHQMALCGGCGNSGFRNGNHWYCPELVYKSGNHINPLDRSITLHDVNELILTAMTAC